MFITEYLLMSLSLVLENAEIRRQMVSFMPTAPSTGQTTDICHAVGNRKNNATVARTTCSRLVKILAIIIMLVRPCVTFVTPSGSIWCWEIQSS
jgi:hypothetical protein